MTHSAGLNAKITPAMERDASAFVAWHERAAIMEHDGGLDRDEADRRTSRELGYTPRPREVSIIETLSQRIENDAGIASKTNP